MGIPAPKLAEFAAARAEAHVARLDAGETHYWVYPAESSKSRGTVVLIHGYRGDHHGLAAIAGGLADFEVIIPDLPGFGRSDPLPGTHSIENYATWLDQFLAKLGLSTKAHLVGHSFGTIVLSAYAANRDGVRTLTLINPVSAPALKGPKAMATAASRIYYRLAELLPSTLGLRLLKSWLVVRVMSAIMAKTRDRRLRAWIHGQHHSYFSHFRELRVASEGYRASISRNVSEYASVIQAPVLIVAAELDDITTIATQRRVVALFPNARIEELTGVGHLVHYEAPGLTATLISEFIASIDTAKNEGTP